MTFPLRIPADLAERLDRFTGRDWAVDRIRDWLATGHSSALLVLGAPGTGKSLLAAHLVARAGLPVRHAHFLRASTPDSDPLTLVERLAATVAARHPAAREAMTADPTVSITGTATVGRAAPGATVTGVHVAELHIHGVPARFAFDRTVRRGMAALRAAGDRDGLVVLVDALDEGGADADGVATLLRDVLRTPPPGLRFVLTARPDQRLLRGLPADELWLVEDEPDSGADITAYAERALAALPAGRRRTLAAEVARASRGNFLYASAVLADLAGGVRSAPLPTGLAGLYGGFLDRELARGRERWADRYRPLLGLLVVARGDGLTADWLTRASGLRRSEVDDALHACAQYLTGPVSDGPLRPFHQSFRDYLLAPGPHRVYPEEAEAALVGALLADPYDDYPLAHLPEHLAATGATGRLAGLLDDLDWLVARAERHGVDGVLAVLRAYGRPELLRVVRRAAHQVGGEVRLLAQQLLTAARELGDDDLADRCHGWLLRRGTPFVAQRWRTGAPPAAVRHVLTPPGERITTTKLAVSGDWRRVAAAGLGTGIGVWDVRGGELRWQRGPGDQVVSAVALSRDGQLLAEASDDRVTCWDTVTDERRWQVRHGGVKLVRELRFSPDDRFLCGSGREALLLRAGDGRQVDCWASGRLVTFGGDSLVLDTGAELRGQRLSGRFPRCWPVAPVTLDGAERWAVDDAGRWLAVVRSGNVVELVNLSAARPPDGGAGSEGGGACAQGGAAGSGDGSGYRRFRLPGAVRGLAVAGRDGRCVVTLGDRLAVVPPDGAVRTVALPAGADCHLVAVDDAGQRGVAVTRDGALYEFDLDTLEPRRRLTGLAAASGLLARPDERLLILLPVAHPGIQVVRYDDRPPARQPTPRPVQVTALGATPDGRHAVVATDDDVTELWDVDRGTRCATLRGGRVDERLRHRPERLMVDAEGCGAPPTGAELALARTLGRRAVAVTPDAWILAGGPDGLVGAGPATPDTPATTRGPATTDTPATRAATGGATLGYAGCASGILTLAATSPVPATSPAGGAGQGRADVATGPGVVAVSRDGHLWTWLTPGEPPRRLRLRPHLLGAALDVRAGLVAAWPDAAGGIGVWELAGGLPRHHLPAYRGHVRQLVFAGGLLVATSAFRELVEFWDPVTGERVAGYPLSARAGPLAATGDGQVLAADLDHNLYLLTVVRRADPAPGRTNHAAISR